MFAQFNTVFESPENGGSPKLFIYSGYLIIQRFVISWFFWVICKQIIRQFAPI